MLEGHPRSKGRVLSGRALLIQPGKARVGQGGAAGARNRNGVRRKDAAALELNPRSRTSAVLFAGRAKVAGRMRALDREWDRGRRIEAPCGINTPFRGARIWWRSSPATDRRTRTFGFFSGNEAGDGAGSRRAGMHPVSASACFRVALLDVVAQPVEQGTFGFSEGIGPGRGAGRRRAGVPPRSMERVLSGRALLFWGAESRTC